MHAPLPTNMSWNWQPPSTSGCSFRCGRRLPPWTALPRPPALGSETRLGPQRSMRRASTPWRPKNARPPRPSRWPNEIMAHAYPSYVHTPGNRRLFPLPSSSRLGATPRLLSLPLPSRSRLRPTPRPLSLPLPSGSRLRPTSRLRSLPLPSSRLRPTSRL